MVEGRLLPLDLRSCVVCRGDVELCWRVRRCPGDREALERLREALDDPGLLAEWDRMAGVGR